MRLARRTGQQYYQTYAQQLVKAYSDDITQRPYICSYLICGLLEMFAGEQSNNKWCSEGNINISSSCETEKDNYEITLKIKINDGWHLNQLQDVNNNPVPVKIKSNNGLKITNIIYPEPIEKTLGFQTEPVNVYENEIKISFTLTNKTKDTLTYPDNLLKFKLELQACDDQKCIAPEVFSLLVLPGQDF